MSRLAPAALLAVALFAAPALAQDAAGEPVTIDALVVDYSTMLAARAAGGPGPNFPLTDASVRLVLRGKGLESQTIEARTDGDGRLRAELSEAGPGSIVEFLVGPSGIAAGEPMYYAKPWEVGSGPAPAELRCFGMTTDPHVLRIGTLRNSLALGEDGRAELRTQANVVNLDPEFRVFFGVPDPASGQGGIPIVLPEGFELSTASIDGAPAPPKVVQAPHGGRAFIIAGTLFPAERDSMREKRVQLVSTAPYESGRRYDFSFHSDVWIGRYILTVEEAAFHVTQPDVAAVRIYDAGAQEAQGGGKMTRAFVTESVTAHTDVAITVHGGTPFPVRAVVTTSVIALIVLAGAFLGLAMRRSGVAEPDVRSPPEPSAAPKGAQPGELERLERRRARGEITSVEYEIRKRALAGTPPPRRPGAPKHIEITPGEVVEIIEGRAGGATREQLREDVHTLARLLREQLDA